VQRLWLAWTDEADADGLTDFYGLQAIPLCQGSCRLLWFRKCILRRAEWDDELAYSNERKAAVLAKMLPPDNMPLGQLAKEEGISAATLAKWRADARARGQFLPDAKAGPEGWTSEDKLAAVIETASLNEAELGEYCRRRGIYAEQLAVWREACARANDWERAASRQIARETKDANKRIQQLERELARKEKALAEAAALMILRKKAEAIWGPEGGAEE
jgi:transposase-like protein